MVPQVVQDWHQIFFALFNLGLVFVASQICRALGISRQEKTLEIYHRATTRHVDSVECVEYKTMTQWQIWLCLLFFLAATIGSGFLAFTSFGGKARDFWTGIAGVAVFGTMLVISIVVATNSKHNVLADHKGIYGSILPSLRSRILSWDEVQQMEVVTKRGIEGDVYSVTAIFKNMVSDEQMRVFLRGTDDETRARFFKVVLENARLRKQS